MIIQTINPATETILETYKTANQAEINTMMEASQAAYLQWKNTSIQQRQALLFRFSTLLNTKKMVLSQLITQEMGKPITQAEAEVDKCIWLCQHYAEHAEEYLQGRLIQTDMKKTKVIYEPIGIILGIMPWNFPLWQVLRFAIPCLMAGNGVILKHAPISTGMGKLIAQLFQETGFPACLFQQAIVDNTMAAVLIGHPHIKALSFTGSEKTGRSVASLAASHLKKSVLELGGNDPYLVFPDADLDLAALSIVNSRLNNCGQVCVAAKRIILHQEIHDQMIEKLIHHMNSYQVGDPENTQTTLGPLARNDLRQHVHEQLLNSVKQGAQLLAGGVLPSGRGYFYPPSFLCHVQPGMPAFDEEIFGPVLATIKAASIEEMVYLANQSSFGLASALFTRDLLRGEALASSAIDAGTCFINASVSSDPRVPFGGIKQSGFGRELSMEGIHEFVNVKTISIQ